MNVRDFLAFMDSFGEFDEETEEYPEPAGQEKG